MSNKESTREKMFLGSFMLILGALIGNAVHGPAIAQIKEDTAVLRVTVKAHHPQGFTSADSTRYAHRGNR